MVMTYETRVFAWAHQTIKSLTTNHNLLFDQADNFREHLIKTMPDVIRSFYKQRWPNVKYWGDKNPHYVADYNRGCMQTTLQMFPDAKFLHIIRDGRDVVASLLRRKREDGTPWTNFDDAHWLWNSHVDNGCEFGRRLPPSQYYEMHYEDLVADDEREMREVFKWLEIPFADKVIDFIRMQQVARFPFSSATRDLSLPPSNVDWSKLLTADEQIESMARLGRRLRQHGYAVPCKTADVTTKVLRLPEKLELLMSQQGIKEVHVINRASGITALSAPGVLANKLVPLLRSLSLLGPTYGDDWVEMSEPLPSGKYRVG